MRDAAFLHAGTETAAHLSRAADKFRIALSPHSRDAEEDVPYAFVDVRAGTVLPVRSAAPVCRAGLTFPPPLQRHIPGATIPQRQKTRSASLESPLLHFQSATCRGVRPRPPRCDQSRSSLPQQKLLGTAPPDAGARLRYVCRCRVR